MAKEKVEFNPALHGEQLEHCIKQCSDHKAIIEGANEAIREIRKTACEELGVSGKDFNQMLRIFHKDEREKLETENEELLEKYDAVFRK
ncbi:dsDNA binding protein [Acinetobacter phage vB_AbaM_PhT2]|uniref:DsDNA binding protein n=2 Tax=Hadassahvirus TaxID=2842716 RepID=A0A6B9SYR9_9CAUD|nr:transcriptional regulator [Acinetobacter phage AbTZA1]YP_009887116.1 transcriptional regulator [Acinetobacter phage vB_AbaM_PhT2]QQM13981.1 double-stranded DNA binding protein [Acinetobacter phage Maestro]QQM18734.1 double-stranded DNA binding protein [Acinetobacter phage Morttis]QQO96436.1 double-stranded DNA binding protein [Acinetobacter phage Minot]QQO96685.1 double-stranded DNA binding protein [Acinetobacter phage Mokit]QQO96938.1 double-stranded DNA binding protein [Acinetobacter pha